MSEDLKICLAKLKSDVDGIIQVLEAENRRRVSGAYLNERGFLERLQEIDASQDALTDALSEAHARFTTCAAQGKQACNSILPINRLPPETLTHIFEHLVEQASFDTHYQLLYRLACVSSRWKALVESSPSLWTRISSRYTLSHTLSVLHKSGSMPLVVKAEQRRIRDDLAGALRNCSSRWRALEVSTCDILADNLEEMSLSNLRYLNWKQTAFLLGSRGLFSASQPGRRLESVALLHAPLEGVALHSTSLDFLADAFASLKSLKYLKLDSLGALQCTVPCLSSIFVNNTRLEHVAISSAGTKSPNGEGFAPFSLPFLTTFSVTGMRPELVASILRSLNAPTLKALNASGFLSQYNTASNSEDMTDVMSVLLRAAHGHFAWVSNLVLEVAVFSSGWQVEAIGIQHLDEVEKKNYTLWLRWNSAARLEIVLSTLSEVFGENAIDNTPMQLHLTSNQRKSVTIEEYQALHDSVPRADLLIDSMQYHPSTIALCSFLSQPMDSSHWPFSSLRTLDMYLSPKNDPIVSMLHNRLSAPTQIRRLNLQTPLQATDSPIVKAKEMLGQAAVTINEPIRLAEPDCWGTESDVDEWFRPPM